ncbi:hypothetical protein SAY86_009475 [Trapa natans]|uniref:Protein TIFY n=1 Tax=Trapa natans TaxID=22666 RepID=A0AAN7KWW8_TRANT|nr:hypothetical protein SAY86_009475 [Trapa natans]
MATGRSSSADVSYSQTDCGKPALNERPNFSQTCSLLSQYLKEKGTFGDLGLCMSRSAEENGAPHILRPSAAPTVNFLMMNDRSSVKPVELFHHQIRKEELSKMADASKTTQKQPEAAQMTLFYAGQVMVFDDFPAERVKEIMMLARKASSSPSSNTHLVGAAFSGPSMVQNPMKPGLMVSHNPIQDRIQRPAETIVSDLPIARRASLHRFLEKRKDRITARSPYSAAAPEVPASKPSQGKPWLGLAAQPTQ